MTLILIACLRERPRQLGPVMLGRWRILDGQTILGGQQPINRADQDEIRPTPSTPQPRPWAVLVVGLVDRVGGPREPNEAMLLPLGVVFVQAEAQCPGGSRQLPVCKVHDAERQLLDSRSALNRSVDVARKSSVHGTSISYG